MAGDKFSYSELDALIKSMAENATTIKTNLESCNNLVKEDINTGKGIWDGSSAASFATKFDELSNEINTLCSYVLAQSENLKTAVKKIGAVDGTVN